MARPRPGTPRRSPKSKTARAARGSSAQGSSPLGRVPARRVIAEERVRLREVAALLKCLYEVLLTTDEEEGASPHAR